MPLPRSRTRRGFDQLIGTTVRSAASGRSTPSQAAPPRHRATSASHTPPPDSPSPAGRFASFIGTITPSIDTVTASSGTSLPSRNAASNASRRPSHCAPRSFGSRSSELFDGLIRPNSPTPSPLLRRHVCTTTLERSISEKSKLSTSLQSSEMLPGPSQSAHLPQIVHLLKHPLPRQRNLHCPRATRASCQYRPPVRYHGVFVPNPSEIRQTFLTALNRVHESLLFRNVLMEQWFYMRLPCPAVAFGLTHPLAQRLRRSAVQSPLSRAGCKRVNASAPNRKSPPCLEAGLHASTSRVFQSPGPGVDSQRLRGRLRV